MDKIEDLSWQADASPAVRKKINEIVKQVNWHNVLLENIDWNKVPLQEGMPQENAQGDER